LQHSKGGAIAELEKKAERLKLSFSKQSENAFSILKMRSKKERAQTLVTK
jgi:hypothetical protein